MANETEFTNGVEWKGEITPQTADWGNSLLFGNLIVADTYTTTSGTFNPPISSITGTATMLQSEIYINVGSGAADKFGYNYSVVGTIPEPGKTSLLVGITFIIIFGTGR